MVLDEAITGVTKEKHRSMNANNARAHVKMKTELKKIIPTY